MTQQAIVKAGPGLIESKRPLIMKSGIIHWLSMETAAKLEQALATQTAHGFIAIKELGVTINTAEIGDGVLTMAQYEDYLKKKSGMWQCPEGNWHEKRHFSCTCREDKIRDQRRKLEQQEREARDRMTPEQEQRSREMAILSGEQLVLRGILSKSKPVRRSTIIKWIEEGNPMKIDESQLNIIEDIL